MAHIDDVPTWQLALLSWAGPPLLLACLAGLASPGCGPSRDKVATAELDATRADLEDRHAYVDALQDDLQQLEDEASKAEDWAEVIEAMTGMCRVEGAAPQARLAAGPGEAVPR